MAGFGETPVAQRAAVVLLLRGDEVLLTQRSTDAPWGANQWHIPGGSVETGESAINAAVREIYEEVGVKVAPKDLQFQAATTFDREKEGNVDTLYFSTRHWQGEPYIAEPDKCQAIQWARVDNLPEGIMEQVKAIIGSLPQVKYLHVVEDAVKDQC